jgi:hypothetical protein
MGDSITSRLVNPADLCGIHFVAEYVKVTDQAVSNWIARGYIEPLPWLDAESKHLLHWPTVKRWLVETKRLTPKGRPWKKVPA